MIYIYNLFFKQPLTAETWGWQMRHELSICASFLGRCHQTITEVLVPNVFFFFLNSVMSKQVCIFLHGVWCNDLGEARRIAARRDPQVSYVFLLLSCHGSNIGALDPLGTQLEIVSIFIVRSVRSVRSSLRMRKRLFGGPVTLGSRHSPCLLRWESMTFGPTRPIFRDLCQKSWRSPILVFTETNDSQVDNNNDIPMIMVILYWYLIFSTHFSFELIWDLWDQGIFRGWLLFRGWPIGPLHLSSRTFLSQVSWT